MRYRRHLLTHWQTCKVQRARRCIVRGAGWLSCAVQGASCAVPGCIVRGSRCRVFAGMLHGAPSTLHTARCTISSHLAVPSTSVV